MSDNLPSTFWALPASPEHQALQAIYHILITQTREEYKDIAGFGILDEMYIERVCFMWYRMKVKEQTSSFDNDRAYKEFVQLWDTMAARLRKLKETDDVDVMRNKFLKGVLEAMNGVFSKMHPDVAEPLKQNFADAFEAADL